MIVVIDHFDSFVETLARYVREAGYKTKILRQTASVRDIIGLDPSGLILSPGPGTPDNTGVSLDLLQALPANLPVLGVCLGHQVLAKAYGGTIGRAREPRHGKASLLTHNGSRLFDTLPSPFEAAHYHALIVESLPTSLQVTAHSALGEIMAFEHITAPIFGVQFHPESVLTPQGRRLIENFLTFTGAPQQEAA